MESAKQCGASTRLGFARKPRFSVFEPCLYTSLRDQTLLLKNDSVNQSSSPLLRFQLFKQQVIPLRWAAANRLCQRAGGCSPVLHHELDGGQGSLLFGCPLQSPCSPGQPQPCLVLLPDGCRGSKLRPSFSPRPGQKASSSEPMLFVV